MILKEASHKLYHIFYNSYEISRIGKPTRTEGRLVITSELEGFRGKEK